MPANGLNLAQVFRVWNGMRQTASCCREAEDVISAVNGTEHWKAHKATEQQRATVIERNRNSPCHAFVPGCLLEFLHHCSECMMTAWCSACKILFLRSVCGTNAIVMVNMDHFVRSGQGLLAVSLVSGFHIINCTIYNTLTQAGVSVRMALFTWLRNRV